jgi:O-antigen ligase
MQMDFVHKYSKLLYLPILAVGFQYKRSRDWAVYGFLLAMLITAVLSIFKTFGFFQHLGVGAIFVGDPGAIFLNHILTGYFMAFAAFLAAIYALRSSGIARSVYALLFLLYSYQTLFVNPGRTGYVMFAVLTVIFFLVFMRRSFSWLLIVMTLFLAVSQSSIFRQGVAQIIDDTRRYQQGSLSSSVGFRMQFHHYAQQLFLRNPVLGVGTGAFPYYFSLEKPVPNWGDALLEPHGEYWLIAAEHGILGLFAFALFIGALVYEATRLREMQVLFVGLLCSFLIGCASDGLLLLSAPGYFLILFAAMGLGESLARRRAAPSLIKEGVCTSP